jgi:hypothetical protein
VRTVASLLLLAAVLCACADPPVRKNLGASQKQMLQWEPRLVLVTVGNPPEAAPTRAASGIRSYDTLPTYSAGEGARATSARLAGEYHLQSIAEWPIAALKVHCVVFKVPDESSREELLGALSHDSRVRLAQPLQRFTALAGASSAGPYNDPYVGLQRGFAEIDAAGAQQWSRGEGIRVAVIDTGLDATHPDLAGRIETQRNFVDDTPGQFSADRHGTEVAGVIGADANNHEGIVGVAPGVRILALKACWQLEARSDGAQCNSFTLAKGLAMAIDSGARIINLSLGGPPDPLLTQLLTYALNRGIVIVGAVPPDGNMGGFPVGVPGVIPVDSLERTAAVSGALRAPGREVLTLTPGGHYDFVSGSSLAAAHVSGAVALLMATDHRLDAGAIYALLLRTSGGADGSARGINVCAAIAAVRRQGTCPVVSDKAMDSTTGSGHGSRLSTSPGNSAPHRSR